MSVLSLFSHNVNKKFYLYRRVINIVDRKREFLKVCNDHGKHWSYFLTMEKYTILHSIHLQYINEPLNGRQVYDNKSLTWLDAFLHFLYGHYYMLNRG